MNDVNGLDAIKPSLYMVPMDYGVVVIPIIFLN